MKRVIAILVVVLSAAPAVFAQDAKPAIFIAPTGDGFETYIVAALTKKSVPATVAASPEAAQMTLKTTPLQAAKKVRMKLGGCLAGICGSNDKGPSAQLLDHDGAVVWSCAVETDDESTKKEVAEEIATRLKRDYFRQ